RSCFSFASSGNAMRYASQGRDALWPRRPDERDKLAGQSGCTASEGKGVCVRDLRCVRIRIVNPGREARESVMRTDDLQVINRIDEKSVEVKRVEQSTGNVDCNTRITGCQV